MGIYAAILVQNAGAVGGLDGSYRFGLRTSPLLTAVDMAILILKLVCLMLRGRDLRTAVRIVWKDRMDEPGSGIDATWRISMGCFVLGTLTQSVKLLACSGIPWTQAITGICLVSFVLFELLRVLAHPAQTVDLDGHTTSNIAEVHHFIRKLQKPSTLTCCFAHVAWWIWVICLAVPAEWKPFDPGVFSNFALAFSILTFLGMAALWCFVVFSLASCVLDTPTHDFIIRIVERRFGEQTARLADSFMGLLLIAISLLATLVPIGLVVIRGTSIYVAGYRFFLISVIIVTGLFCIVMLQFLLLGLGLLLGWVLLDDYEYWDEYWARLLCFSFASANVITLFLYYSTVYKPEQTYKPNWVDKFG